MARRGGGRCESATCKRFPGISKILEGTCSYRGGDTCGDSIDISFYGGIRLGEAGGTSGPAALAPAGWLSLSGGVALGVQPALLGGFTVPA